MRTQPSLDNIIFIKCGLSVNSKLILYYLEPTISLRKCFSTVDYMNIVPLNRQIVFKQPLIENTQLLD